MPPHRSSFPRANLGDLRGPDPIVARDAVPRGWWHRGERATKRARDRPRGPVPCNIASDEAAVRRYCPVGVCASVTVTYCVWPWRSTISSIFDPTFAPWTA